MGRNAADAAPKIRVILSVAETKRKDNRHFVDLGGHFVPRFGVFRCQAGTNGL
jgi:hypothetical protein